ncbi:hypothetical protein BC937DRAFT_91652 [Endogone sp. FLAS-F59071]|nr:hypothetical protein BC937DRAFT_91652 [Endogone sp. FLAS-F59071]|eukprot:RUS16053.1 hypothetical protein BC937DRAFT_91652 [Endogone sp. FLAS-F59071]
MCISVLFCFKSLKIMATRRFRAPSSPSPVGFAPTNLLLDINLDILYHIMECMDNETLIALAQTNRFFYNQCRKSVAFAEAVWRPLPRRHDDDFNSPPVFNPRGGVLIGTKFYFPFMTMQPACYALDLETSRWSCHDLDVEPDPTYQPFVTSAVAIGHTIYLFGGRKLQTYQLSNTLYKLDVTRWTLRKVEYASGTVPRPRHEHSVDVLGNRYLAIFGGLCYHSAGENDVFFYDTEANTWLEPTITGRTPHIRFGHSSAVIGTDLYVFGGSQIENEVNIVYDDLYRLDCNSWVWYKYDPPEAYRYRRMSPPLSDDDINMNEAGPSGTNTGSPVVKVEHLIPATGQQPSERFHCGMIVVRQKLVIFGGHTITTDHDDNPEPYDYPLHSVDVFCTVRNHWTRIRGRGDGVDTICPQDMCYSIASGSLLQNNRGHGIVVIGQQKIFEKSATGSARSYVGSGSSAGSGANEATTSVASNPHFLLTPVDIIHAQQAHLVSHLPLQLLSGSTQLPVSPIPLTPSILAATSISMARQGPPASLRLMSSVKEHLSSPLSPTFANRNDAGTGTSQHVFAKPAFPSPTFGTTLARMTHLQNPMDHILHSPTKENLNPFDLSSTGPTDPSPAHHFQKHSVSPAQPSGTTSTHPLGRLTSFHTSTTSSRKSSGTDDKSVTTDFPTDTGYRPDNDFDPSAFDDEGSNPSPSSVPSSNSSVSQHAGPSRIPVAAGTEQQQPSVRPLDNPPSSSGSTHTRATLNSGSTQHSNSSSGSTADHWFCKDNRRFSLAPFRMILILDGELEAERVV